ncbi:hypothetical protein G7068_12095 [Leucobacter viscericola]|uniref:Uncharacterized protein n=1 Tax=Leucobacter viscericola TaxID=2714935 RepID=A0A6G7XGX0_9MICO|nr:hypothetical protein [Leucobacter viscericola]QIK63850.1 hypothetical protein G7068_12095 [Leucobacter viscericola]
MTETPSAVPGPVIEDPVEPPVEPKKRPNKKALVITIAAVVVVAIIAAIITFIALSANARANQISDASKMCEAAPFGYDIIDDGDAVEFMGAAKSGGADSDVVFCILHELGAPQSIETKVGQTRSLDGTREAEWDGWKAQWTYHPDSGLNLLVERDN